MHSPSQKQTKCIDPPSSELSCGTQPVLSMLRTECLNFRIHRQKTEEENVEEQVNKSWVEERMGGKQNETPEGAEEIG